MAFAGGLGAKLSLPSPSARRAGGEGEYFFPSPIGRGAGGEGESSLTGATGSSSSAPLDPAVLLFSESNTRFLCEVQPENAANFETAFSDIPHARIGEVATDVKLEIQADNAPLVAVDIAVLREAWQKPLRW